MSDRIYCCVLECRRSFKTTAIDPYTSHGHDEIMCGRCYRTAEPQLVEHHKRIHRRWRRAERLACRKAVRLKLGFGVQIETLDGLFRRACARSWAAIKADVQMKSRLRVEGTAGWLAAKRAGVAT